MATTTKSRKKTDATPAVDPVVAAPATEVITSYKGFDRNLQCRGFQYEVGKTYEHTGDVVACESGFHACEHPLDVFSYYPPTFSRYAEVKQSGAMSRPGGDTKIASARITIEAEIALPEIIQRAVKWVFDRAQWSEGPVATEDNEGATASGTRGAATASGTRGAATASGTRGAATASGTQGAATASGTQGAATASGYQGAATASGYQGAATASGYQGAATASGDKGAATESGYQGAATASGTRGAATASGTQGAATASGDQGAATASGTQGAATASGTQGAATASGYQGAATASGDHGAATASGYQGRVMADKDGCALFLVYREDNGEILHAWAGISGRNGIKPGIWYSLNKLGIPQEIV